MKGHKAVSGKVPDGLKQGRVLPLVNLKAGRCLRVLGMTGRRRIIARLTWQVRTAMTSSEKVHFETKFDLFKLRDKKCFSLIWA